MKKIPLTKKSHTLLEMFDEAAQIHGWEKDQGTGPEPEKAKVHYDYTKSQLEKRICYLEKQARAFGRIMRRVYAPVSDQERQREGFPPTRSLSRKR